MKLKNKRQKIKDGISILINLKNKTVILMLTIMNDDKVKLSRRVHLNNEV